MILGAHTRSLYPLYYDYNGLFFLLFARNTPTNTHTCTLHIILLRFPKVRNLEAIRVSHPSLSHHRSIYACFFFPPSAGNRDEHFFIRGKLDNAKTHTPSLSAKTKKQEQAKGHAACGLSYYRSKRNVDTK